MIPSHMGRWTTDGTHQHSGYCSDAGAGMGTVGTPVLLSGPGPHPGRGWWPGTVGTLTLLSRPSATHPLPPERPDVALVRHRDRTHHRARPDRAPLRGRPAPVLRQPGSLVVGAGAQVALPPPPLSLLLLLILQGPLPGQAAGQRRRQAAARRPRGGRTLRPLGGALCGRLWVLSAHSARCTWKTPATSGPRPPRPGSACPGRGGRVLRAAWSPSPGDATKCGL